MDPSIARSASRLRLGVLIGMALIAVGYLLARIGSDFGIVRLETQVAGKGPVMAIVSDVAVALFLVALWRLAAMLNAVARGPIFGLAVTRAFRGFALFLFLSVLAAVAAGPVGALAAHSGTRGRVEMTFDARDLVLLAGSLFLFLLARMFERARAIEAELEEIV